MERVTTGTRAIIKIDMSLTPQLYQGKSPGPTLFESIRSWIWFLALVFLLGFLIYAFVNFQKTGQLLGKPKGGYKFVQLIDLLAYASTYNDKKICTRGFYIEASTFRIIKVNLNDDEFTKSMWVNNLAGDEIIPKIGVSQDKYVDTQLCGLFRFTRGGEFGQPAVWNYQMDVENFKNYGEPQAYAKQ